MKREDVDIKKVSPMMKEYLNTKKEYEDAILFYRLGDFYEMFFDDAELASHELELTLTSKSAGLDERVPMCGVPHHSANIYIERLIEKGYKVAICEQVEDPKYAKGIVKREVVRVVSAGTITDTNLINEKDFNYIASITDYKYVYAISYADILSGRVYTTFINKDENKLISFLVNLNIKEVIISSSFDINLKYILSSQYNIYISIYENNNEYSNKKIFKNIKDEKLINNTTILLNYLVDSQKQDLSHIQEVTLIDSFIFLELDKDAIRNLELVETIRSKTRQNSLLGFMDKTRTSMGSRLLKSFIISPLKDKEEIIKRQNITETLIDKYLLRSELRELLYQVYDLERLTGKVACSTINPKDMLQLKTTLGVVPDINNILESLGYERLETFDELFNILDKAISLDAPITIKEGDIIKAGYNKELDELKDIRKHGKNFISNFEKEERERTGIKNLKIGYNKVFGYYIEISKGQLSSVKDEFNYDRKQTLTNCERFITPLLKEKENMILNAEEKINTLEYEIFCEIKEEIKKYISSLQKLSSSLAFYDVMQSFATISEEHRFVKPKLNDNNEINVIDARHPVVEAVINDEYIPNDVLMDKDTNILIITGPNMSGKSTYMRMFGIIVIMCQIGCYVPAKSASLPIFDKIFTRIGASDDLVAGESTFMVEMKEASYALKNATNNSLILFDELGRGTSTYDGMALAGSIIKYISKNVKCKTLFSTHYHELTTMEESLDGIKNVHVSALEEKDEVIFLHKVMDGAVDKSYGINVAKLASLPKEVIKDAQNMLNLYEKKDNKKVKQFELPIEENDELRDYIDTIDVMQLTPIEALQVLDNIKKIK